MVKQNLVQNKHINAKDPQLVNPRSLDPLKIKFAQVLCTLPEHLIINITKPKLKIAILYAA